MKKVSQVMKTNDYSNFSILKGNRSINKAHLSRLKKSIEEESLVVPIIVNEKYQIIDGQNRYNCWKELEMPIYYMQVDGYGLKQVQRLNSNVRNWSLKDYADSYEALGNKEYRAYKEFRQQYGLGDYESIALLQNQDNGSGKNFDAFRQGKFKVVNYKLACEKAEKLIQLSDYYDGYKRRSFVFSILHCMKNAQFDFKQLLSKLKYQSSKLVHCTDKEQYLLLLQKIYNYKSTKKINLIY